MSSPYRTMALAVREAGAAAALRGDGVRELAPPAAIIVDRIDVTGADDGTSCEEKTGWTKD